MNRPACWCRLLPVLLLLLTGGCSSPEERSDPEYDMGIAQLLVVPFQHKQSSTGVLRWYYESPTGVALARATRQKI
ncbi:MAG: hypothetical protein HRU16_08580 [Planctomycetes bacterium]|nr:hypothetical protein [Planctomycetota bacterium]